MYEFFFFFFFLFGLDEKIEKKREREREREKIYHIITMMMMFCLREIYDRKGTRQRKSALMERV